MFKLCKAQKYQNESSVCILIDFSLRYLKSLKKNIHDTIFYFNY